MNIKEKTRIGREPDKFTLHKEGIFYKCYNEDAMLFVKHIKPYKINCNFVKTVGEEVLSLGFPLIETEKENLSFSYISEALGAEKHTENNGQVIFDLKNDLKQHYAVFRDSVIEKARVEVNKMPSHEAVPFAQELISMIKNFDLANSTPMQGLNFIQQLKKEVQKFEGSNGNI